VPDSIVRHVGTNSQRIRIEPEETPMAKKIKKVFKLSSKLDFDRDDGIFIMLHEWDVNVDLTDLKKFEGRKVRITVETID